MRLLEKSSQWKKSARVLTMALLIVLGGSNGSMTSLHLVCPCRALVGHFPHHFVIFSRAPFHFYTGADWEGGFRSVVA